MRTCTLVLLSLLALATAQAQPDTGSTRYLVTTEQVKPEKAQEWLQRQVQEVLPALRKAGVTQRSVYRTVLGDTTEFVSYLPFPDYAEFDGPDALERALGKTEADDLKQRLNACLLTTHRQPA